MSVGQQSHHLQFTARQPEQRLQEIDRFDARQPVVKFDDHLAANLAEGAVVNRIKVDEETAKWAKIALDRMLAIQ